MTIIKILLRYINHNNVIFFPVKRLTVNILFIIDDDSNVIIKNVFKLSPYL